MGQTFFFLFKIHDFKAPIIIRFLISEKGFLKNSSIMFFYSKHGFFKIPSNNSFDFEHKVFDLQTKGFSYFKNFEHGVFDPKHGKFWFQVVKGFLFQRILNRRVFEFQAWNFFCVTKSTECFIPSKGVSSYFKNFEHRMAWNWAWRHSNNTLIIWFL